MVKRTLHILVWTSHSFDLYSKQPNLLGKANRALESRMILKILQPF